MSAQIVVLSSIEWSAVWQRHQAFATQWAAAGHEVFFIENTAFRAPTWRDASRVWRKLRGGRGGEPAPRLRVANPFVLPPTNAFFRALNDAFFLPRLAARLTALGLKPGAIAFVYLPTRTSLSLLDRLNPALTAYDCVDNFYGLPSAPADLASVEGELLRRSALVLTTSRTLYEEKAKKHPNVVELHHGVSDEFFLDSPPKDYRRLCYFGTVWRALDYAPVRALAEAGYEVTLLGPVKEAPSLPPSVRLRDGVPHERLAAELEKQDVLLLPYAKDEYNKGVIPAKIYECLATGRPVVASPLPALEPLGNLVYRAEKPRDWVATVQGLPRTETAERRAARVAAARERGQAGQFARLRAEIERSLAQTGPTLRY